MWKSALMTMVKPTAMPGSRGGRRLYEGYKSFFRSLNFQTRGFGQVVEFSSEDFRRRRNEVWEREASKMKIESEKRALELSGKVLVIKNPKLPEEEIKLSNEEVLTPAQLPWIETGATEVDEVPVIAKVKRAASKGGDLLWDMNRPLNEILGDSTWVDGEVVEVEGFGFGTQLGSQVFWHSSAHMLGHALELEYGLDEVWLCDGPPLEGMLSEDGIVGPGSGGFFYDLEFKTKPKHVEQDQLKKIQNRITKSMKGNVPFERLELSVEAAQEMFAYNPRKLEMIDKLTKSGKENVILTAYKTGDFIDLCRGPHVPHTGLLLKGIKVLDAKTIQDGKEERVYGITFPHKNLLKDWISRTEEAAKRDHRKVGRKQELFMFHKLSPGSAFMLPHGTIVYNRLLTMLRDQYTSRGYDEVMTPLIYSSQLWKQSGHSDNYRENMYKVSSHVEDVPHNHGACGSHGHSDSSEADEMGLKPMNCPGHCLVYSHSLKSFRDLPVRLADFSALHRNEASGALGGMTRLRRFHQDDAHIFCTQDQMHQELLDCIEFVRYVYEDLFDFKFRLRLSTKPEGKSIGTDTDWEHAESTLKSVLDATKLPWQLDPGEGAFYGPKIDISVTDALGRQHQCATIQLDFQLPERFDLEFTSSGGDRKRPVMIHRAVLGSVERFLAILIEHTNGKFPFWLSPRQVMIIPVDASKHGEFAHILAAKLRDCCCPVDKEGKHAFLNNLSAGGICVQVDEGNETLSKRVRNAQQAPFSVILVVGDEEVGNGTVAARSNDGTVMKTVTVSELIELCTESVTKRKNNPFPL